MSTPLNQDWIMFIRLLPPFFDSFYSKSHKQYLKYHAGTLPAADCSKAVSGDLTLYYLFSGPLPFMSIQVGYPNKLRLLREFSAKAVHIQAWNRSRFVALSTFARAGRGLGKCDNKR